LISIENKREKRKSYVREEDKREKEEDEALFVLILVI
jgi:hypothetical protein